MKKPQLFPYILIPLFVVFLILQIRSWIVKPEAETAVLQKETTSVIFPDGFDVKAEVVRTPEAQAQGLSGREALKPEEGMLFFLEEPGKLAIWMKGMRFPIDALWIRHGTVVYAVYNAPVPEVGKKIPSFYPSEEADTILEVPAGTAEAHGVSVGTEVRVEEVDENSL
ncbi:MAG TPA: DUF192 domain-containing protein [Patescibacteria group bacterium]|nr:DUF192 domain-containing protein [Patescibacteria group bacterium]